MFIGLETEYAFAGEPGWIGRLPQAADALLREVAKANPSLLAKPGGVFLGTGGRFYIDAGYHPEYATPEVTDPWEAHHYVLAGDRLLQAALQSLASPSGPGLRLARSNVDYANEATWACHENYSFRCEPAWLPTNLIPHLVSRICYTGAGGLDPFRTLRFVLSPRVCFLEKEISGNSTGDRGIFHLKDEPHATDGSRRLHVLCGESLSSERSAVLRVGTTALLVALTERGDHPGRPFALRKPLAAMRALNADPTLTRRVALTDGRQLTAIELQRALLDTVECRLAGGDLPAWAGRLCQLWAETLDRLERSPESLQTELDWVIKRQLFAEQHRAAELSEETCALQDRSIVDDPWLFEQFERAVRGLRRPANDEILIEPEDAESPEPLPPAKVNPVVRRLLALRHQLAELDGRFAEFTATRHGLFRQLQLAGALPAIDGAEDAIARAMREPPRTGRARLRGEFVRAHAGQRCYMVDWSTIREGGERQTVLGSPGTENWPAWQPLPKAEQPESLTSRWRGRTGASTRTNEAESAFNRGDYLGGLQLLDQMAAGLASDELLDSDQYWFLSTRLNCRAGRFAAGLAAAGHLAELREDPFDNVCTHMVAHRYEGLLAGPGIWDWIQRGHDLLAGGNASDSSRSSPFLFRQIWAHALLVAGRTHDACALLEPLLRARQESSAHPRIQARGMADLAECYRRLGRSDDARHWLHEATLTQHSIGAVGDLADYTLRVQVKLDSDDDAARAAVALAADLHAAARSPMGDARMLLVEARRLPEDARRKDSLGHLRQLTATTPALQTCPLRERIEREWDSVWCARRQPVDMAAGDFYWGL